MEYVKYFCLVVPSSKIWQPVRNGIWHHRWMQILDTKMEEITCLFLETSPSTCIHCPLRTASQHFVLNLTHFKSGTLDRTFLSVNPSVGDCQKMEREEGWWEGKGIRNPWVNQKGQGDILSLRWQHKVSMCHSFSLAPSPRAVCLSLYLSDSLTHCFYMSADAAGPAGLL